MKLVALTLLSAFLLASPLGASASAGSGSVSGNHDLVDRSLRLLSRRGTDNKILAEQHSRRRHHSKGASSSSSLKKRGKCPARNAYSGSAAESAQASSTAQGSSPASSAAAAPVRNAQAVTSSQKQVDQVVQSSSSSSSAKKTSSSSAKQEQAKTTAQPASTSSSSSSKQAAATSSSSASTSDDDVSPIGDAASLLGSISGFQGKNSGIGSWFRTNAGSDSTNGESWCQTKYQDNWECFAPSLKTMMSNFGYDYNTAAKAYCGREVQVTNPNNGNSRTMFICDAFDDRWVLSPGSIDITVAGFTALYGSFDNNKNTVIKGVEWQFTGGVVEEGTFKHGKTY